MGHQPNLPPVRQTSSTPTLEALEARDVPAVSFRFDYSFDTSGFFNDPAKRELLNQAAAAITPTIQDNLSAITPDRVNTWTISFTNPANGRVEKLTNARINANELVVYVFGANLPGNTLARELEWSYTSSGYQSWHDTLKARGQTGALSSTATDTGPWGGFIAFDTDSLFNTTSGAPAANAYDFLSVAEHELMHVLGFGANNPAFSRLTASNGVFLGGNAAQANGGVPLNVVNDAGEQYPDHWAQNTRIDGQTPTMVPVINTGVMQRITRLDLAALKDIGWQVAANTNPVAPVVPPVVPPVAPPPTTVAEAPKSAVIALPAAVPVETAKVTPVPVAVVAPKPTPIPSGVAVGYNLGNQSYVGVLNATGTLMFSEQALPAGVGVKVATGDFNADGIEDMVMGSGPGSASVVRVLDGATRTELFRVNPFETAFTGGVNIAVADINQDGRADLVVTPDIGGGPRVRVFDGQTQNTLADFFGIEDPNFRGGARATLGDANGDGVADLFVAAGQGGGPRVALFEGRSVVTGRPVKLIGDFFAADTSLRDGVMLAAGDLNGDGVADLLVGAVGPTSSASVLDGRKLTTGNTAPSAILPLGMVSSRAGLQVAVTDVDNDGRADAVLSTDLNGRVVVLRGQDFKTLFDINLLNGTVGVVSVG